MATTPEITKVLKSCLKDYIFRDLIINFDQLNEEVDLINYSDLIKETYHFSNSYVLNVLMNSYLYSEKNMKFRMCCETLGSNILNNLFFRESVYFIKNWALKDIIFGFEEDFELKEYIKNLILSRVYDTFKIRVFKGAIYEPVLDKIPYPLTQEKLNSLNTISTDIRLVIIEKNGDFYYFSLLSSDLFKEITGVELPIAPWALGYHWSLCNEDSDGNGVEFYTHPRSLENYVINDFITDPRANFKLKEEERQRLLVPVRHEQYFDGYE